MKELNNIPEFSKYFQVISPSEININKEDIFYRDKYNDIINFIKTMLTNHNDPSLNGYIEPYGTMLINVNPRTDIVDYLQLIAKNYYLDIIEFNEKEIFKTPNKFLESFIKIIDTFGNKIKKEDGVEIESKDSEKNNETKILLINQEKVFKQEIEGKNLLKVFLDIQQQNNFKFIDANLILIWVNYDIQDITDIANKLYDIFDLFIRIPLLNKIERETLLKDYLEKNNKIVFDINEIVNYTENWEVKDILQLVKVGIFKHFLNAELNDISNEITDNLIDLIVSGEFIPSIVSFDSKSNSKEELKENNVQNNQFILSQNPLDVEHYKDVSEVVKTIRETNISDFMLNQLYENAASKNYTELVLILDKLAKKEPLEDNEMKMIAKYSFILNDSPNKAQINLEKAKKRVDLIRQAFGK